MHERRLARAGRPDDGDELGGGDRHGDAAQGVHHVVADVILLREIVNGDHSLAMDSSVVVVTGFAGAGGTLPANAYISVATAFSAPAMP